MDIINQEKIFLPDLLGILEEGGVLVFPTETAYGLIADSTNKKAVDKIYKIKGRDFKKPLPVVCSSLKQVREFFYLPPRAEDLAKKYWPGPLSIILPVKISVTSGLRVVVNPNKATAAVRITTLAVLQSLAKEFSRPLTATSANLSGRKTLYKEKEVLAEFRKNLFKPDAAVLAGDLPEVPPSTIVELVGKDIKVLRPGPIKINK